MNARPIAPQFFCIILNPKLSRLYNLLQTIRQRNAQSSYHHLNKILLLTEMELLKNEDQKLYSPNKVFYFRPQSNRTRIKVLKSIIKCSSNCSAVGRVPDALRRFT